MEDPAGELGRAEAGGTQTHPVRPLIIETVLLASAKQGREESSRFARQGRPC